MDCIYFDLKKTFDKILHKRLLWKLEHIGGLKEEKHLGVVIQDNLSPEKHINRIFGDTFMMIKI